MKPIQQLPLHTLLLLVLLPGCVTEVERKESPLEEGLMIYAGEDAQPFTVFPPRYTVDPPMGDDIVNLYEESASRQYNLFKDYASQTYHHANNEVTRHYYLDTETATNIVSLMCAQIDGLSLSPEDTTYDKQAINTVIVEPNFLMDTRRSEQVSGIGGFSEKYNQNTGKVADLVVVKTTTEKLIEVDSFLSAIQNEIPLIEIRVAVAELSDSDSLQYGLQSNITPPDGVFLHNWLTRFNTESLFSAGAENFAGGLFSLGGIHDQMGLDARLELIQRMSNSDIVSAPSITVLNGHRAVIVTSEKTPIPKAVATSTTVSFSYEYKSTGIKLVIVPHLLPGNIIQIQVSAEVSSVTGSETVELVEGPVQLPIISRRNISTKLRVEDGKDFILGGLLTFSDIEVVSKVPLLGDIPILGYLFRNTSMSKAKSDIIFKITPRVVRAPGGLIEKEEEEGS